MAENTAKTSDSNPKLAKIKQYSERLIHSKHMLWLIGLASFLESIIVPIPLEAILIPLMQARRQNIFAISFVALLGCMAGASVGYAVGYFAFDAVGMQLVSLVSTPEQYESVQQRMQDDGFWFVFSVGVIPIPFQIAMLAAGATQYSFLLFIIASALSRSLRYYGLALVVWYFGNRAQAIFQRHKLKVTLALVGVVLLIWGWMNFR